MSRMTIGLLSEEAALSAAEANGNPAVVDEIAQGDAVVSDELTAAATEADELQGAIDEGAASVEELSEGVDAIETEIADNGGLDQPAMESYMRQLKSIARRNTLPIGRRQVSLESHASKVTRLRASKLALEDWKESLNKAWEAIKAAFARAKEIVVNFFKALFDRAERVKQKAEKLKAAATAAKGSADDKAKVKLGGLFSNLAKHLQVNGELPSGAEMLAKYKTYVQGAEMVARAITDDVPKKMEVTFAGITASVNKSEPIKLEDYKKVTETIAKMTKVSLKCEVEGHEKLSTENMLGDRVVILVRPTASATDEQVAKGIGSCGVSVQDAEKRAEAKEKEIAPMSVEDIVALSGEVIKAMDALAKLAKSEPSKIGGSFDAIVAKFKGWTGDAAAKEAAKASALAAFTTRMAGSALSAIRSYMVSVSDATLTYAAASLKTLKGGEAAAAPAAA